MAKSRIIKELANSEVTISTALKRTKVLLQELDNQEILNWVNYEIEGYPKGEDVPEYRMITGQLRGTYFKGSMASHMTYNNVPLSLGKMPDETKRDFLIRPITEGIEALNETIEQTDKGGTFAFVVPADFYPIIAHFNNDPYMMIVSANVELSIPQIRNIFSKVESKLLDILAFLEKKFGLLDELDIDVEAKTDEEIKEIINHIYYIIFNDNSVEIGDKNKINNSTISSQITEKTMEDK